MATILFANVDLRAKTKDSSLTPASLNLTNVVNYGVLAAGQLFEMRVKAQLGDTSAGQPEGQYGLPLFSEMITNNILKPEYLKLVALTNGGAEDGTVNIALRVVKTDLVNFNASYQTPNTNWGNVVGRIQFEAINATTLEPIALSYSRNYDLRYVRELPVDWYPKAQVIGDQQ